MSKNLVFVPFAFDSKKKSGSNIHSAESNRIIDIYLKNCCVALFSTKSYNEKDDVALVTNLKESEMPSDFLLILKRKGILIVYVPFDSFIFPENYRWGLAFYKLCALKKILELYPETYDNLCYVDSDVFVSKSMTNIWRECKDHILLYDILHGLENKDYVDFLNEYKKIYNEARIITQYGGEFFASNRENAKKFIVECFDVYNKLLKGRINFTFGDEFILSKVADTLKINIRNAGAYCCRYWTGTYYLSPQSYMTTIVWHVPAEKGMLQIYHRYICKEKLPSFGNVIRVLHLNHQSFIDKIKSLLKKWIGKK